jgi:hypothetical protein
MTVLDSSGRVVFTQESVAGQPLTTTVRYLAAGTYTVRFTSRGVNGAAAAPVWYDLFMLQLDDDVGPYKSSTTMTASDAPPSSPPSDTTGSTSGGTSGDGTGYTYSGSSNTTSDGYYYYY